MEIEKFIDECSDYFENKIDILINNAGITSDNLAIRLVAGAEYHVATNWWLLTETGYEQVVAREMQIDPSNFRVLFGFNYRYTNY